MDVSDVKIVIQYGAPEDMCIFWQRIGRAARGFLAGEQGIALLLSENMYFDETCRLREERQAKKRKAKGQPAQKGAKKQKLSSTAAVTIVVGTENQQTTDDQQEADVEPHADQSNRTAIPPTQSIEDLQRSYKSVAPSRSIRSHPFESNSKDLEPAVDDYINCPPRSIKCRRTVLKAYFGEHYKATVEDAKKCDPDREGGCSRCAPSAFAFCCDLCDPSAPFPALSVRPTLPMPKRSAPRRKVKPYEPTPHDIQFHEALRKWRETTAKEVLSPESINQKGYGPFMAAQIFTKIVDYHHAGKLISVEAIRSLVGWGRTGVYGPSLFNLITRFAAQTKPPPPPAPTTSNEETAASKLRKCSACNQSGHNRRNQLCPAKLQVQVPSVDTPSVTLPLPHGLITSSASLPILLPRTM
jgi:hypothetical protein